MELKELLTSGKSKKVYLTDQEGVCCVHFIDEAAAFEGLKRGIIPGKGKIHNDICARFFELLEENGIPTHYLKQISDVDMLVRKVDVLPVTIVVRNFAAGNLCERFGIMKGTPLKSTVVEFRLKQGDFEHPLVNRSQLAGLGIVDLDTLDQAHQLALKVNEVLRAFLKEAKVDLVDMKLEFGLASDGSLIVADEITPASCRFWDAVTRETLDMDLYRHDLGDVQEGYMELAARILGQGRNA